jgi:hypothetical protein
VYSIHVYHYIDITYVVTLATAEIPTTMGLNYILEAKDIKEAFLKIMEDSINRKKDIHILFRN